MKLIHIIETRRKQTVVILRVENSLGDIINEMPVGYFRDVEEAQAFEHRLCFATTETMYRTDLTI